MKNPDIGIETLRENFSYEADTGILRWKKGNRRMKAGEIAGCKYQTDSTTYGARIIVCLKGKIMLAHRVIWAIQTGAWPTKTIDHINHDAADNRWCNLREATQSENNANRRFQISRSTSGYLGVSWHRKAKKWMAQLNAHGEHHHLGLFPTKEAAHEAYKAASKKLHGEFSPYHKAPSQQNTHIEFPQYANNSELPIG